MTSLRQPFNKMPNGFAPKSRFNSATNGPASSDSVINFDLGWNPPSKTALGRMTYKLEQLPSLFIVDVKVIERYSGHGIGSQKLRKKALQNLLHTDQRFQEVDDAAVGIHLWAGEELLNPDNEDQTLSARGGFESCIKKEPIDHLIIPISSAEEDPSAIFSILVNESIPIKDEMKMARNSEKSEHRGSDQALSCRFLSKGKVIKQSDDNPLYRKSIEVLIRSYITQRKIWEKSLPVGGEYLQGYPHRSDRASMVHKCFEVWLRYDPKIELTSNSAEIHLDYDLVPAVSSQLVSELLDNFYGIQLFSLGLPIPIAQIKRTLCGLEVSRVDCTPEVYRTETTSKHIEVDRLSPDVTGKDTRGRLLGECHVIRDVKMPGDVAPFYVFNGTRRVKVSVNKYFEDYLLHDRVLEHPNLPLANIGRTEHGREVWVPLEELQISGLQILKASNCFTHELQAFQGKFLKDHSSEEVIERRCKSFFEIEHMEKLLRPHQSGTFYCARAGVSSPRRTPQQRKTVEKSNHVHNFGILYFASSVAKIRPEGKDGFPIMGKIKHLLQQQNNIVPLGTPVIAQIGDVRSLLLEEQLQNGEVSHLLTRGVKVLLAIVETYGRSKSDLAFIRAEINKFGDKKLGAVTLTTTTQSLQKSLDAQKHLSEKNPLRNLLLKMRYMTGGQNFEDKHGFLQDLDITKSKTMIAGAHLSHPDTRAAEYCPSVAAVVATTSASLHHYFGSARIQPTIRDTHFQKPTKGCDGRFKYTTESRMVGLKAMMTERFEEWCSGDKTRKCPEEVIFYRHGLPSSACRTIEESELDIKKITNMETGLKDRDIAAFECRVIAEAWKSLAGGSSLQITYIAVVRNSKEHKDGPASFTTAEDETEDILAKHKYMILYTSNNRRAKEDARRITQDLNESSQLGNPVSIALPVHWARKLSHRMYSYFHPFVSRDISTVTNIIRKIPETTKLSINSENLTQLVQNYVFDKEVSLEPSSQSSRVAQEEIKVNKATKSSQALYQPHLSTPQSSSKQTNRRVLSTAVQGATIASKDLPKEQLSNVKKSPFPWHKDLTRTMFYL
ncbi:hypothetical protein P154DRAFT_598304 [Amniculicola lignicola CBS 123094]|uniref:Piwi domain-containing protein n=1 Tax=Amniculicola lignicola CBS 123094 TaxID=1392246 RepID=A0A6A5WIU2_9PLEO|nr:hypothetical protein P154DRAFT_598304 [Amniculicola lignicola CBS 123094]